MHLSASVPLSSMSFAGTVRRRFMPEGVDESDMGDMCGVCPCCMVASSTCILSPPFLASGIVAVVDADAGADVAVAVGCAPSVGGGLSAAPAAVSVAGGSIMPKLCLGFVVRRRQKRGT